MRNWILSVLVVLLVTPLMAQGAAPSDPMLGMLNPPLPEGTVVEKDIVYREIDGQKQMLNVYIPASVGDGIAPAVIYVHGGGWMAGDRNMAFGGKRDCVPLIAAGFVVVTIDYRLAPKFMFPAQIEDSKAAVRFVRANAERFHIDPDRIGAMGESAGGHLVAMLGLAGPSAGFDVGENLDQSSSVKAVVALYGVFDLTKLSAYPKLTEDIIKKVFPDDTLKSGSPVTYITPEAPPFLVIHGDKDTIAPVEQSDLFVKALEAAGDPVQYIRVKNAQHGFWQVNAPIEPSMPEITKAIVAFFQENLNTVTTRANRP